MKLNAISFTAGEAITANELLELDSNGKAVATSANSTKFVGLAMTDAAKDAAVVAYTGLVEELTAAAAIAPGQRLVVGGTGKTQRVIPFDSASHTADMIIGVALEAAAADGDTIKALLY